jgi:hypothetical protein
MTKLGGGGGDDDRKMSDGVTRLYKRIVALTQQFLLVFYILWPAFADAV